MIMRVAVAGAVMFLAVSACEPEVGSDTWCEDMKEKPKGDWTLNEASDFARHCVIDAVTGKE